MRIRKIELENFRNYAKESVTFDPGVNMILGPNAQGKTNLLESICLASVGRSFRAAKDRDLIFFGRDWCRVKAFYEKEGEEHTIEIVIGKEGKKAVKADGVSLEKSSELLRHIYTVIFSPEDLKIVKDEPARRRNFIDRELCQLKVSYQRDLVEYKRILRQKNSLLKAEWFDEDQMDVWDEHLALRAAGVMEERARFAERIDAVSREIHSGITQGSEMLEVRYVPGAPVPEGREEAAEFLKELWKKERGKDRERGTTGRGPHKDDLESFVNGRSARQFGSQGQQRTVALSLKLAEMRIVQEEEHEDPVLLLDDVFSELDEQRRDYLVHSLGKTQLSLTTTDLTPRLEEDLPRGKKIYIREGKATEGTK